MGTHRVKQLVGCVCVCVCVDGSRARARQSRARSCNLGMANSATFHLERAYLDQADVAPAHAHAWIRQPRVPPRGQGRYAKRQEDAASWKDKLRHVFFFWCHVHTTSILVAPKPRLDVMLVLAG